MSRFPAGSKIHLTPQETHPHSGRCRRREGHIRIADGAADAAGGVRCRFFVDGRRFSSAKGRRTSLYRIQHCNGHC